MNIASGLMLFLYGCRCVETKITPPLALGETNILLIINCTLRADRLERYGYSVPSSPHWLEWTKKGITFDGHIAQAPWTRPSLGSIMTGHYPRYLGLDNPADSGSFELVLQEQIQTIAELFQQQNYYTIGAVGNPNAKAQFGLAQGFESYHEPDKTFRERTRLPNTEELTDFILREQRGKKVVFAQLITVDTHQKVQFEAQDMAAIQNHHPKDWQQQKKTRLSATYDASVHYLDRQLQSFIEEFLIERPNTLIIQTADHGEGLLDPEHHGRGHGRYLYPSTVRVPHVWVHPSLPSDVRVETITRNIDIVPTVIDVFQLPNDEDLAGESYASLFQDSSIDLRRRAFVETFYGKEHKIALYDSQYYWIADQKNQAATLYAFSDAAALTDISSTHNEEMSLYQEQAQGIIEEWPLLMSESKQKLDSKVKEQLEAIGYIE